jgi:hypothetical protein
MRTETYVQLTLAKSHGGPHTARSGSVNCDNTTTSEAAACGESSAESQRHVQTDDAEEHCDAPTEIDRDRPHRHPRNQPTEELDRWIGHRVHQFDQQQPESFGTPRVAQRSNKIDDEPGPHREEIKKEQVVRNGRNDRNEDIHGLSMREKKLRPVP